MTDYDTLLQSIRGIAKELELLQQRAVLEYRPLVEGILRSNCRDAWQIERTLDGLLDFCGYEPALALYRKLCRYYWDLDPVATAFYVNAYREMWDSESEEPAGRGDPRTRRRRSISAARRPMPRALPCR